MSLCDSTEATLLAVFDVGAETGITVFFAPPVFPDNDLMMIQGDSTISNWQELFRPHDFRDPSARLLKKHLSL